jgi:hypothetical protein
VDTARSECPSQEEGTHQEKNSASTLMLNSDSRTMKDKLPSFKLPCLWYSVVIKELKKELIKIKIEGWF